MSDLFWIFPAFAGVIFVGSLWKLSKSGRRLLRQVSRAEKTIRESFNKPQVNVDLNRKFKPSNLDVALRNRKSLFKERAKAKSSRQRRLVRRLKSLSIEGKRD